MNNDAVNHPSHYTFGNIECIDAIEASMKPDEFRGYLKGCILKYMWRYENKEEPLQDLKKARWYLNKLVSTIENKKKPLQTLTLEKIEWYLNNMIETIGKNDD